MSDCQRWNERRASYRPARETIRPSEYDVAPIEGDNVAREFVERHHYSGSYPAARERFGFYRFGELVGVAVFSHPTNDRCLTNVFRNVDRLAAVDLGRLVLLDEVAANGESYFVARCFEHLKARGFRGVISSSDPLERTALDGRVVMPGHVGTVYQALNARYIGPSSPGLVRILPDGLALHRRTIQKIRAGEKGWAPAAARLVELGAPAIDAGAERAERVEWLHRVLATMTRTLRHPGNHRYVWAFDRRVSIPPSAGSYPKRLAA